MHRQAAFKADHVARQRQSWDDAFAQVRTLSQMPSNASAACGVLFMMPADGDHNKAAGM